MFLKNSESHIFTGLIFLHFFDSSALCQFIHHTLIPFEAATKQFLMTMKTVSSNKTIKKFTRNIISTEKLHKWLQLQFFKYYLQAFLDFCGFDFTDFRFNVVYNSIQLSSPLVLLSNRDLRCFRFPRFFYVSHINSINRGMPVFVFISLS